MWETWVQTLGSEDPMEKGIATHFSIFGLENSMDCIVPKNWCFWTVVLKKTLESPLDCKIKPVNPERNQSWIFIRRTDAEAPILWSPDAKSQLIRKDPTAGKDRRQKEKGMTGDEMVGWHHRLNGHWVWASSRRWWRTVKPGVLQSMGSQRTGHQLSNWKTTKLSTQFKVKFQLVDRSQFIQLFTHY